MNQLFEWLSSENETSDKCQIFKAYESNRFCSPIGCHIENFPVFAKTQTETQELKVKLSSLSSNEKLDQLKMKLTKLCE